MRIYTCGKCLFCFERAGKVDICPDCAAANIRLATDEEAAEYGRNKEESNRGRERRERP